MFVGSKVDLRESACAELALGQRKEKPLKYQELVNHLSEDFNAPYLECSSLTDKGINEIFM